MNNYLLLSMLCIGAYIVAEEIDSDEIIASFTQAQSQQQQSYEKLYKKDAQGNNLLHTIVHKIGAANSFQEVNNLIQQEAAIPATLRKQFAKEKNSEGLTPSALLQELIKKGKSSTSDDQLLVMKCLAFRNAASPELQEGISFKPTFRDGASAIIGGAITFAGIWIICQICHSPED